MDTDDENASAAVQEKRKPRLTRAEKSIVTKERLFRAAAQVVGEHGYANATVALITMQADVAQGTFYNYFESRQDLFDELLPSLGAELLDYIGGRTAAVKGAEEKERQGFVAFFDFLKQRPEFYRILYEAELFAPQAYQRHVTVILDSYVRLLERAFDRGELCLATKEQIEPIALSLMAARQYICMHYAWRNGKVIDLPGWVVDAYMAMIGHGIFERRSNRTNRERRSREL
jgi:AcrR family transcriptional regulator